MGSPPAAYSWSTYFCSASWEHLGKLLSARQTACSGCSFSYSLSDASWQALSVRQAASVDAIVNDSFGASWQTLSARLAVCSGCTKYLFSRQGLPFTSRRWMVFLLFLLGCMLAWLTCCRRSWFSHCSSPPLGGVVTFRIFLRGSLHATLFGSSRWPP